jgi:hypothetical protein
VQQGLQVASYIARATKEAFVNTVGVGGKGELTRTADLDARAAHSVSGRCRVLVYEAILMKLCKQS